MKRAWYLGISADQIAPRVVLVGDPKRIDRLAKILSDVEWLGENRGLRAIAGSWAGFRVMAASFGMGGPIAAIVLHELFDLGARSFLRVGTAMTLSPVKLGDFVVSEEAICHDGTSQAYVNDAEAIVADPGLRANLGLLLTERRLTWHRSRFASYDAFYRDMFAINATDAGRVTRTRASLAQRGVQAIDMESAALFAAAHALGAHAATLCVATVDSASQTKLDAATMATREAELFEVGLDALVRTAADIQETTA